MTDKPNEQGCAITCMCHDGRNQGQDTNQPLVNWGSTRLPARFMLMCHGFVWTSYKVTAPAFYHHLHWTGWRNIYASLTE
jgi:hypothetical protein